jgi:hypothetical protein
MTRLVAAGATVFAVLGGLFALLVVSFADCAGPSCGRERVVGVLGHAAAGLVLGALLGAVVALVRHWRRRA